MAYNVWPRGIREELLAKDKDEENFDGSEESASQEQVAEEDASDVEYVNMGM